MTRISPAVVVLLLLIPLSSARAEQGLDYIVEDTVAQFLHALSLQGLSGKTTTITVPRETYQVTLDATAEGQPDSYVIHRPPALVEVHNWKIQPGTFTADQMIIWRPRLQVYQGTAESVKTHLRRFQPLSGSSEKQSLPAGSATTRAPFDAQEFVKSKQSVYRINELEVRDGGLLAVDTLREPAALARLEEIALNLRKVILPVQLRSAPLDMNLSLKVRSPKPGQVQVRLHEASKKDLSNFTFGCQSNQLDISYLAPFLPLDEKWQIHSGVVDLVVDATSTNNQYHSHNLLRLDNLEISATDKDSWLSALALKVLAEAGSSVFSDVQLDFEVSGNLSDPKFDLAEAYSKALEESLIRWTTLQALRKIGLDEQFSPPSQEGTRKP